MALKVISGDYHSSWSGEGGEVESREENWKFLHPTALVVKEMEEIFVGITDTALLDWVKGDLEVF